MSIKPWAEDHSPAVSGVLIAGSAFLRNRDGSTAAEFALSVMVLVTFLFCIMTFGWMFYLQNSMETAAREGARALAVQDALYEVADVTCDNAQGGFAEGITCAMLPPWGSAITVNASDHCVAVPPDLPERYVSVEVSANGQDVALADIFGFFNGKTVSATVEMRREAECPPTS
jgi:hypothetical protein